MIRMHRFLQNNSSRKLVLQAVGSEIIIQPPAFVFAAGVLTVAPPGVMVRLTVEKTETVDQFAFVDEIRHPFPFHWEKTGNIFQAHRVMDVDGFVADVEISRNDEVGNLFLQVFDVVQEIAAELHFKIQPFNIGSGRHIHRNGGKPVEVRTDDSPFAVVAFDAAAVFHMAGFDFRGDADAAVAFSLRRMPIAVVT